MEIIALKPTGFTSNCFIIHNENDAFVIDPSVSQSKIISALKEHGLHPIGILLTHGHFDHIWHAEELRKELGIPLYVHTDDAEMLTDSKKNAFALFTGKDFTISEADGLLHDGDELKLGEETIKVIHTPGHTRGSVCYDTGDCLITGDTLFAEGFGRCDLYGGDMNELKASLHKLFKMAESENRFIYTGHGESSTLKTAADKIKFYF